MTIHIDFGNVSSHDSGDSQIGRYLSPGVGAACVELVDLANGFGVRGVGVVLVRLEDLQSIPGGARAVAAHASLSHDPNPDKSTS